MRRINVGNRRPDVGEGMSGTAKAVMESLGKLHEPKEFVIGLGSSFAAKMHKVRKDNRNIPER